MNKEQYTLMYRLEDEHWWYIGMREITHTLVHAANGNGHWRAVLDAGCGTGGTLSRLPAGSWGVGVDFSPDALQLSRERGLKWLAQASVEDLPFADASFDLVLCSDVIYHLGVAEDTRALREFCRVLRPGGMAVIRVPAYNWLRGAHDAAVHTRHRYTRRELHRKMAAAGFEVVRTTHANTTLFPLALAKRLLEGRLTPPVSELQSPSRLSNWLASQALRLEALMLSRIDLPWGLSVIGVARKPAAELASDTAPVSS
ncbi:MAG: class I SAM-dependent methyltransferase [Chloroflexi bacterium]|nr:class I SAM-dependent methyltransferase [Chloroflexota bacterium]MCL5025331.1 class I SAM-dependent methyltransferase [Chloroflexota bacterium]